MDATTGKAGMRKEMEGRLRAMSRGEIEERSARAAAALAGTPAWRGASTVLAFLSMPQEIDTTTLIAAAHGAGKTVAVPVMEDGEIVFVVMHPGAGPLPRDRWGIPVPDPSWRRLELTRAGRALVAAPGLAFDRQGNRLGRGKGFYDRFLLRARAAAPGMAVIGIGFAFQLVDEVPHGPADQRVDGYAHEAGVIAMP
jgi:5-formyltetrahydrofolate cyclo-ligase